MARKPSTDGIVKRTVSLTDDLVERISMLAKEDGREFSAQLRQLVKEGIAVRENASK